MKQVPGTKSEVLSTRGTVISVNTSDKKGVCKEPVSYIELVEDFGVSDDAHGGGDRQLSILEQEQAEAIDGFKPGMFGENITVEGVDLSSLEIGARIRIGSTIAQLTEKGKVCPRKCSIYYKLGDCIMPRAGLFFKVLEGGRVKAGDNIEVI